MYVANMEDGIRILWEERWARCREAPAYSAHYENVSDVVASV